MSLKDRTGRSSDLDEEALISLVKSIPWQNARELAIMLNTSPFTGI